MFIPKWAYIQEWGGAIFETLIGLHIWETYIWGGGGLIYGGHINNTYRIYTLMLP